MRASSKSSNRNVRPATGANPNALNCERLEGRLMLSGTPYPQGPLTAADYQTVVALTHAPQSTASPTTTDLSDLKHGPLSKADGVLASLYQQYAAQQAGSSDLPQAQVPLDQLSTSNGAPQVRFRTSGNVARALSGLQRLGLQVLSADKSTISGYLPVSAIAAAARVPGVLGMVPVLKPFTRSVGRASDQGDQTMRADVARSLYGVDGTGVKIGVISDSVNQAAGGLASSVASGDLPRNPPVQVLRDGVGGEDEGRAMLEEIHDLAPGASLAFYTSGDQQSDMAVAIAALAQAGCKIIVDDVGYGDEPFFQQGVIGRAINNFVARGGQYFSAIGNDSASGYLRTNVQWIPQSDGTYLANFALPGQPANTSLGVTIDSYVTGLFQWDNQFNGISGNVTSDVDITVTSANGRIYDQGLSDNFATGVPEEVVSFQPGTYTIQVRDYATRGGAALPDMIKLVVTNGGGGGITATTVPGIRSSGYGHAVDPYTISVGAVPYYLAPPFGTKTPIHTEGFSSTGPVIYAYDAAGNRLVQNQTFLKPDLSAIDGVQTTLPLNSGLNPFYGTSAAAPNAAAVAALIDQFRPGLTEAVVFQALKASATPLNGAGVGQWDAQAGYGLIDAAKALGYFAAPKGVPTATFAAVVSPRVGVLSSETISFNEPVTGFDISDLSLTFNGGPNLLTSAQTLTTTNNQTFTLNNLAPLTQAGGTYILTFNAAGSGVKDASNVAAPNDASVTWTSSPGGNASVAGRFVFYNHSAYDRNLVAANAYDDAAIAPDKTALLPGQTATYANYTNYTRGLNGIMVDIAGLPTRALTVADFRFRTGTVGNPNGWSDAPLPSSIVVRPGAGVNGSSRVEILWPDYSPLNGASAVSGKWLQVTVMADANTGLSATDVFYFGNLPGETGDAPTAPGIITAADTAATTANVSATPVPITSNFDFNRDTFVGNLDVATDRNNESSGLILPLITGV